MNIRYHMRNRRHKFVSYWKATISLYQSWDWPKVAESERLKLGDTGPVITKFNGRM